jgi:transcription antitermination factor NusG
MHLDSIQAGVDSVPDGSLWYAAYTKHQHEKKAAEYFSRNGFEVFLPLYAASHRWKDRTQIVSLPLFPCYVFLKTNLARKLDILRTPGVFGLVGNGGGAVAIPDFDLEMIRKVTESRSRIEPHPYLNCGDRVRVRVGPLAGSEGILTKVKNRYRVVVSIELLLKSVAVEVDLSALERLNTAPYFGARAIASRIA